MLLPGIISCIFDRDCNVCYYELQLFLVRGMRCFISDVPCVLVVYFYVVMSGFTQSDSLDVESFVLDLSPYEISVLKSLDCGHYTCVLIQCLRLQLALCRSTVLIANVQSVLATGVSTSRQRNIVLRQLEGQSVMMMNRSFLVPPPIFS